MKKHGRKEGSESGIRRAKTMTKNKQIISGDMLKDTLHRDGAAGSNGFQILKQKRIGQIWPGEGQRQRNEKKDCDICAYEKIGDIRGCPGIGRVPDREKHGTSFP
jgi:hypothetical protein